MRSFCQFSCTLREDTPFRRQFPRQILVPPNDQFIRDQRYRFPTQPEIAISISYTTQQSPGRDMSIQTLGRCSIILILTALTSGCSIGSECAWYRSSCMYEGQYEQDEEDYAESEAKRLNKNSTDRLRRSSGD